MREYLWHMLITLGLFVAVIFGAMTLSLRFSNDITYTDGEEITKPSITVADPQKGNADAAVTLVVYSDFTCTSCKSTHDILNTLWNAHPQNIRIVWKDMPNEARHAEAFPSAIAARCADKQGKFWEYAEALFENQNTLSEETYQRIANELDIEMTQFTACRTSEDTRPLVERALSEGLALQITATPTLFINSERFTGSMSEATLTDVITQARLESTP